MPKPVESQPTPDGDEMRRMAGFLIEAERPRFDHRWRAIESMQNESPALLRLVARAGISDPNLCVRCEAAEALGAAGSRALDTPRLRSALQDAAWQVRSSAAIGLGDIGGAKAFAALKNRLPLEPHPVVRRDIALSLAEFGQAALEALTESAEREVDDLAKCGELMAVYALTGRGISDFLALSGGADDVVRRNVVNFIDVRWLRPADVERVVLTLRSIVATDRNPGTVGDAIAKLDEIERAFP